MFSGLVLAGISAAAVGWQFAGAQSFGSAEAPPAPSADPAAPVGAPGAPPAAGVGAGISFGNPPSAGGTITLVAPPGELSGGGGTISFGPPGGAPGGTSFVGQPAFVYGFGSGDADSELMQLQQTDAELEGQIQQSVNAYATADLDDAMRGDVRQKIAEMLDKQFALRQQRREREIQQIEDRVKKLREALGKRASAKDKIIERRINDLLSDAEGLGWGDAGPGAGNPFGGGSPYPGGRGMLRGSSPYGGPPSGGSPYGGGGERPPGGYGGRGTGGGGYGRGGGAAPAADGGDGSADGVAGEGGRGPAREER